MRVVLATAFVLMSSAAWAGCANVDPTACAPGASAASTGGGGALPGNALQGGSGFSLNSNIPRATGGAELNRFLAQQPGGAQRPQERCPPGLVRREVSPNTTRCVDPDAPQQTTEQTGFGSAAGVAGILGVGALGAFLAANDGKKTVSP